VLASILEEGDEDAYVSIQTNLCKEVSVGDFGACREENTITEEKGTGKTN
jgi:hypothetical protein